jgi:phage major head subunit gpT-like protein
MPIMRGQYAELLGPGVVRMTFMRLRERAEQYRRYNRVENSQRAYEDDFEIGGFGPMIKKSELGQTILDEPTKLGGVRYVHDTFALGFAISQEMRDDDQYGVIGRLAGALGRSSRITTELYGHDVLNNGFTSTKYVGRDGLALFSTAHPLQGIGGTYANKPAVDVDLSEAAIEAAISAFDNVTDERGIPAEIIPRVLLVNPGDRLMARRILQSAGMPGTNNNDINPLIEENLTVMVSNWLTDKDSWYLLAAPEDTSLLFWWREMPDTKTWDDDDADATFHKIRQRHSVGFSDWRGTYGSQGA